MQVKARKKTKILLRFQIVDLFAFRDEYVSAGLFNRKIGIEVSAKEVTELLSRMCLK